jgi:hypothetical protein
MKGTLKFTGAGWEVEYVARESKSGRWIVDRLSIYQETFNQTIKQPIIPLLDGMQVEFEIEDFWETGLEQVYKVAKLTKPKEEPKDVVLGYKTSLEAQMLDSKLPKQETLEEAAERLSELQEGTYTVQHKITYKHGFIDGAKWNERRCYTEEDLREAFKQSRQALIFEKDMPPVYESFEEWFKQHKKL